MYNRISSDANLADIQGFKAVYPTILNDLTANRRCYTDIPDARKHITEILDVNNMENTTAVDSLARLMDSYRGFASTPPSEEDIRSAYMMAWCLHWMKLHVTTLADLTANSPTRRNRPTSSQVGEACNDSLIIERGIYDLLKTRFRDKFYYLDVMDTIRDAMYTTVLGQYMDFQLSKTFKLTRNLDIFTEDQLRTLIKYKTTPCTWYAPIIIGMQMNKITSPEIRREVEEVVSQMTEFYQYVDDYLNCFDAKKSNYGSDIENGRCTWPVCTALKIANVQQRSILKECYGVPEEDKVGAVMKVYLEIGLKDLLEQNHKEISRSIEKNIQQLPKVVPKEMLTNTIKKAYYYKI